MISSIKKQSPAAKYEKEKDPVLKDDKKLKVKMLAKKLGWSVCLSIYFFVLLMHLFNHGQLGYDNLKDVEFIARYGRVQIAKWWN